MATQQEVIKAFMKSLDKTSKSGKAALDAAVKACSSFGNLKSVVTQLISDCKSATSTETFLKEKCGIVLDNDDTGAITGSDAGGTTTKTAESIVPESGKASYPSGTSFTKRGLKVIVPKKNTLTTAQQTVVQGLYSWWIDSALNLINQSYGYSFTDNDATVKEITLEFVDEPDSDIMAYVTPNLSSTNGSTYKADALTLTVNMSRFNNITADEVNGSKETAPFYLDRVIAHELTHALMAAKIDNFQDMPTFITEGMAELTHGIDDTRASDIEELAANPSQLETLLNANSELSNLDYAAGYIFLRYLAKQATTDATASVDNTLNGKTILNYTNGKKISGTSGADIISNYYADKVTIFGGKGNDSIYNGDYDNGGSSVSIAGGAGNDFILNWGKNCFIDGGSGNDSIRNILENSTIVGGTGNDSIFTEYTTTITAGKGNDTVRFNTAGYDDEILTYNYAKGDGNDVIEIENGSEGKNEIIINLTSGTLDDNSVSSDGSSVFLKIGTGSININYIYNESVKVKDSTGKISTIRKGSRIVSNYEDNSSITANEEVTFKNGGDNSTVFGSSGNDSVYNNGSNAKIFGGAGDDSIENGKFGIGSMLNGGDGNDVFNSYFNSKVTINGGNGDDYIYTESADSSIFGGNGNDYIVNSGSFLDDYTSVTFYSGKNSTLNGGAGNDYIYNYGIDSVLALGGAGNDTIESYGDDAKDVTVNGGKGNDVVSLVGSGQNNLIQYASGDGNDTVSGFNENDTLQIGGGTGTYSTKTSGSDVIVTVGKGKITLEGGASLEKVNINNDMILTNASKSPVTIGSAIKTVNASKRTKAVKITGNNLDNTISGGSKNDSLYGGAGNDSILGNAGNDKLYGQAGNDILRGGAGNDSLSGGKGNDSLWGGSGKDTFIYSGDDGKDIIYGFADNDLLKITGAFSATYSKSKDEVYFKIGSTSKAITLKDFSATSFNVNGKSYKISGSKLK